MCNVVDGERKERTRDRCTGRRRGEAGGGLEFMGEVRVRVERKKGEERTRGRLAELAGRPG